MLLLGGVMQSSEATFRVATSQVDAKWLREEAELKEDWIEGFSETPTGTAVTLRLGFVKNADEK